MSDRPFKCAYMITRSKAGKPFWTKIGVAFTNSDGSLNVKLDAFPTSGELQIRDYVPRDGAQPQAPTTTSAGHEIPDGDDIPF